MSNFTVETRIPFTLDDVFRCYRDELPIIAKYIPNVKTIEVRERKEDAGVVKLVNHWRASAEVPGPLKSIITEEKLGWMDRAAWNDATKVCEWDLEITAFKEAVTCRGQTRFHPDGTGTRMVIAGDLQVDATKVGIPVPRLLAGSIGKAVEAFAVALIKPNQEAVGKAVARYLEEKKQKG
ncbi:MAG: SRPBCC family protein [Deltaproteobacteria bacterium]|nr:SRPBCC family protein [Deltaproteobacteria bacterium]